MMTKPSQLKKSSGFSLLEVLISILIMAIGLLGIAALQAVSLKTNQSAYQRTQATFLAYDMIDRLRANRAKAMAENFDILAYGGSITGTTIEATETTDWLNFVANLLPAGQGTINCTTGGTCTVSIRWDEGRAGGTATDPNVTLAVFQFTAQI